MNRAVCLQKLGRLDAALTAYDAAVDMHKRPHLATRPELDAERAKLQVNRGFCLLSLGRLDDAPETFDAAIDLHERPHLATRLELDADRANLQMNRGNCLQSLGCLDDALTAYDAGIEGFKARLGDSAPPDQADLGKTLSSASRFLSHRSAPQTWAREPSALLVDLLDLAPAENIEPWSGRCRDQTAD